MSSGAAGGADKRQLEIEMNSTLGDLPELSTISTTEPFSMTTQLTFAPGMATAIILRSVRPGLELRWSLGPVRLRPPGDISLLRPCRFTRVPCIVSDPVYGSPDRTPDDVGVEL